MARPAIGAPPHIRAALRLRPPCRICSAGARAPLLVAVGGTVPTNTAEGYLRADVDLDGTVKYTGAGNDRDMILQAIGGAVPTHSWTAQIP